MKISRSLGPVRAITSMALIALIAPFLLLSCEKENGELGLKHLVGTPPGLHDTTLSVITYTQAVDSILVAIDYPTQLALGGYIGNRLLGSRVDPNFGLSRANIVSQMVLAQVNPDFGSNPVVDSVRLLLRYTGSYGDTTIPMGVEVYEIAETLNRDTSFYSDFEPALGQKLGEKLSFVPAPNAGEALQIDLETSYFQQKFADVASGISPEFASNEELVKYFKGIYIKPVTDDGSILYFNLNSSASQLVIDFHNDTDTSSVILNFDQDKATVPINFSTFSQDYTNYPTAFDPTGADSAGGGSETAFIQSMGGVATIIKFPGLENLANDENIIINRAFLKLKNQRGMTIINEPAKNLEVRTMTEKGPDLLIEDFTFGQSTGDGALRAGKLRDNTYMLEITRHIFQVLNSGENSPLAIVPLNKATTASQTVLVGGNNNSGEELKLHIYYTKPKN